MTTLTRHSKEQSKGAPASSMFDHDLGKSRGIATSLKTLDREFDPDKIKPGKHHNCTSEAYDKFASAIRQIGQVGNRAAIEALLSSRFVRSYLSAERKIFENYNGDHDQIGSAMVEVFSTLPARAAVKGLTLLANGAPTFYGRLEAAQAMVQFKEAITKGAKAAVIKLSVASLDYDGKPSPWLERDSRRSNQNLAEREYTERSINAPARRVLKKLEN